MGTGTTGIAALKLKRQFLGVGSFGKFAMQNRSLLVI
jgi:DNA modification methylase